MTQAQLIILGFKIVLPAVTVTALLWVAVYTYLARWTGNAIGKNITILALLVAAFPIPSIMSLFWKFSRQTSLAAGWIDLVIFAGIAVTLLVRTPLWIRLHMTKGNQSYPGVKAFAAQVIRRRGRPVWKGPDGAAKPSAPTLAGNSPPGPPTAPPSGDRPADPAPPA